MAQSGLANHAGECLLWGDEQTSEIVGATSAFDPTRKSGMHRNIQDNDGLQLVFGSPRQLQSQAGLEHGRSIPSADAARNLGIICPRNARVGPMGRKRAWR